ncbi:MAG: methyltransferase domain-containing protein [Candidatus Sumerlaeota bacterium]|nr:methyltransferase domain-containing protein [Candidatus Sumerlaeota bacterium]
MASRSITKKLKQIISDPATEEQFTDEEFVQLAYHVILGRPPENDAVEYYTLRLERKLIDRKWLVKLLLESPEYQDRFKPTFGDRLHEARQELVRQLPKADVIVDIGGACPTDINGALYAMGYPHRAKRLIIVDLPMHKRALRPVEFEEDEIIRRDFGTIEYVHSTMSDLSLLENNLADLVWSGESIEHVSEKDGERVILEVMRVLKPGGLFCLDTPNSLLTRIQLPSEFIHGEHKIEYTPKELTAKLRAAKFEILETKAICPLPKTVANGSFDQDEIFGTPSFGDNPELGYCFYVKCRKPGKGK